MSTDYPYSQQWRERTRERMRLLGIDRAWVALQTGLRQVCVFDALHDTAVSLEIAGPIDELLDRLEEERDAEALADECTVEHPGVGFVRVRRVEMANLGALDGRPVRRFDSGRVGDDSHRAGPKGPGR